jgi:hypothetical protein
VLDDLRGRSSIIGRVKNALLHFVQTGSGAHPVFYTIGTGGEAEVQKIKINYTTEWQEYRNRNKQTKN